MGFKKFGKHWVSKIKKVPKNNTNSLWLSTADIDNIMMQFDEMYDQFKFMKTTPIDFDTWPREDIKHFSIRKARGSLDVGQANPPTQFGFVFNTAPHGHSGKHWISMFVDLAPPPLRRPYIFYYDSSGQPIPPEIKRLRNRIMAQSRRLGIPLKYKHARFIRHQKGNTECGMFAIFMLISMLTNTKAIEYFTEENPHLSNSKMLEARNVVFR